MGAVWIPETLRAEIYTAPDFWIAILFAAASAQGGVVRRLIAWGDGEIGHDLLFAEVKARGFQPLACKSQFIAISNQEPFQIPI